VRGRRLSRAARRPRDPARTAADRRGDLIRPAVAARHTTPERSDQTSMGHRGLSASGRAGDGEQGSLKRAPRSTAPNRKKSSASAMGLIYTSAGS
jgi:hypothetical protein